MKVLSSYRTCVVHVCEDTFLRLKGGKIERKMKIEAV